MTPQWQTLPARELFISPKQPERARPASSHTPYLKVYTLESVFMNFLLHFCVKTIKMAIAGRAWEFIFRPAGCQAFQSRRRSVCEKSVSPIRGSLRGGRRDGDRIVRRSRVLLCQKSGRTALHPLNDGRIAST